MIARQIEVTTRKSAGLPALGVGMCRLAPACRSRPAERPQRTRLIFHRRFHDEFLNDQAFERTDAIVTAHRVPASIRQRGVSCVPAREGLGADALVYRPSRD